MGNNTSSNNIHSSPKSSSEPLSSGGNKQTLSIHGLQTSGDIDMLLDELDQQLSVDAAAELSNLSDGKSALIDKYGLNDNFCFIQASNIINDISTRFTYIKQLGIGASCRVLLVKNTIDNDDDDDIDDNNNELYALKELQISDKYNLTLFKKEIRLLSSLNHPNILKYHSSYLDNNNFYIITQYCSGGDLLERCQLFDYFSERIASQIIYTVCDAINHMHSKGIVHRDLKPGNIVFDKPWPDGKLCIIDLGDSEIVEDNEMYNEFVGTLHYLPPEITRYRHGWELKKGDMWSIGVLTYVLLCGKHPFEGASNASVLNKIKKGKYLYPSHANVILSHSAKSFIKQLICLNVHRRYTANEALKDKWFIDADDTSLGDILLNNLQHFDCANKIQQILVNSIISELSSKDKQLLLRAFEEIDADHNGYIELYEIENYLRSLKMNKYFAEIKAKQIMDIMDINKTGKITFDDFIQSRTFSKMASIDPVDKKINVDDFRKLMLKQTDLKIDIDIDQLIIQLDPTNSGYIDRAKLAELNL